MKKILSFFFCLILLLGILILCNQQLVSASSLTISMSADSTVGRFCETTVNGTLLLGSNPVTNGLVAIQLSTSNNIVFLRTVNTGSDPENVIVDIQTIYSCDLETNPKDNFNTNSLAHFFITVINNDATSHDVLITLSIFDANNCPLGYAAVSKQLSPGTSNSMLSIPIPSWAESGNATVFAAVYSALSSQGGFPYCSEKSDVFSINGQQSAAPTTPNGSQGQYSLTFRIPPKAQTDTTYTVSVSSTNSGLLATNYRTFTVYQPGDFTDDLIINYVDLTAFLDAYNNYWLGNPYDTLADFDQNAIVNYQDLGAFIEIYDIYWST